MITRTHEFASRVLDSVREENKIREQISEATSAFETCPLPSFHYSPFSVTLAEGRHLLYLNVSQLVRSSGTFLIDPYAFFSSHLTSFDSFTKGRISYPTPST